MFHLYYDRCVFSLSKYVPFFLCWIPPGAEALRAPISLNVQFQNALVAPGKVVVKFWETTPEDRQSSRKDLSFQVSQPSASTEAPPHLTGQICRG